MFFFQEFIKPTNREPRKSFTWIISEEKVLTEHEIRTLRNSCRISKDKGVKEGIFFLVRNWFMVELGLFAGLRVSEMSALQVKDIQISDEHSSIIVRHGKGDKKRIVWIGSKLKQECIEYLSLREKFNLFNRDEDFLLTSSGNMPLTKRALQKQFSGCIRKSSLPEHYSIHCLRHTYATFLLRASGNIKLVKEQLGHSSVRTTEVYIGLIKDDVKQALENLYTHS